MFLNQLSNEEKNAFISLSIKISEANGVVDAAEKEMLQEYCKEMEISFSESDKVNTLDSVAEIFSASTDHVKRIVLLESLALAYSDGQMDKEEDELMKKFCEKIGVDAETYNQVSEILKKYLSVVAEVIEII